jgi:hypothetical protein
MLPGSFNPLPGRLVVVGLAGVLLGANYRSRWIETHLATLFTAWVCVLVAHYSYLLIGNHGPTARHWERQECPSLPTYAAMLPPQT